MNLISIIALIFQLIILLFSVIVHEISHGYVAERLGDPTARLMGRLTLNPIKHLDFFGSFLLPLSLYFFTGGGFIFGYAKPVPYNPLNLKKPETDSGKIAIAGPLSNILVAVIFGILIRFLTGFGFFAADNSLILIFGLVAQINIFLAVFNLVPLPPLDGSKVLVAALFHHHIGLDVLSFIERYGTILLLIFLFWGVGFIKPIVDFLYFLIIGQPFGA